MPPIEEWISFQSQGATLVGIMTKPPGEAPAWRGVVFVHGWGGNRIGPHRIIVKVSRALAARGIASLRFDLRGRGDSPGDPDATTLDMMIDDTCAAADFLRGRLGEAPIALWGI